MPIQRPLRVTLVADGFEANGDKERLLRLLKGSGRLSVEAVTLGPPAPVGRNANPEANGIWGNGGLRGTLQAAAALAGSLRQTRTELVLASGTRASSVAIPAGWIAGVRVAVWEESRPPPSSMARWLTSRADGVLSDSRFPTDGEPERLAAELSAIAARPGAGLFTGPPVSVITTVLQERGAIASLLQRVVSQLQGDDEFIIVDGGSTDGTTQVIRDWSQRDPRVRLIEAPGTNISTARNIAIEAARRAFVACTDAGCIPAPGWLEALRLPFADRAGSPSLVTGVYRFRARTRMEEAQAAACHPDPSEARHPTALVRIYGRLFGRVTNPAMPLGRSLAVDVEAWRAVGGFPENLQCAEDLTFGRAIARSGRRCVLAIDAEVGWEPRPSLFKTGRMYYSYGFGDGRSRDALLMGRDLVRALTYLIGPTLVLKGGWKGRLLAAVGAGAYLSLPVARALRRPNPPAVVLRIPIVLAVMDLAKVAGCVSGLLRSKPPKEWDPGHLAQVARTDQ